ncbi:hypothetical protein F5Y18DRAFT_232123 [Xylariaceae sp. FL1019]|nr:hypothetical protein F5Y18DRAFT_232123 [Xylariaceae sp. FL1019]
MFSSGPSSANFKGLRRKISNDGRGMNSQILLPRPSTASPSLEYNEQTIADLLEPALDGPPSPEGLRAMSQQMKRGSMSGPPRRKLTVSSASSSLHSGSATPETPQWERSLEDLGLSRRSSQRSSGMPVRERPESMQIFSKSVFTRKGKLRREMSEQGFSSSALSSKAMEQEVDSVTELPKDQKFMQSLFTRRRLRGQTETAKSNKVVQISGPYNFQHVAHTAKQSLSGLDEVKRRNNVSELSIKSPSQQMDAFTPLETTMDQRNTSDTPLSLDKPLPAPPRSSDDIETVASIDSIRVSPVPSPDYAPSGLHASPIPPPPRTSSRMESRHGRIDSFEERSDTSSSFFLSQLSHAASADSLRPISASHHSNEFLEDDAATEGNNSPASQSVAQFDDTHWPLANSSMSSLAEVPEEDEYHLEQITSGTSFASNSLSLRGSISVPYLKRFSLSQALQRPPSNASDTLGGFDLLAAQRALGDVSDYSGSEIDGEGVDNWEDDIDYCYEHAAEATDNFAWERPSVDLQERERDHAESLTVSHRRGQSSVGIELTWCNQPCQADHDRGHTKGPSTATSVTSNFSLPRISSSKSLQRDHDRSPSNASSFQEAQGFSLSPSLLIPNDYFDQMLQHERCEQSSGSETQHPEQYLRSEKSFPLLQTRSSASTSVSTYSDQSVSSSRHQSSSSSAYTRWTGSSNSSWQAQIIDTYKAHVVITLNDKENAATPTADHTPRSDERPPKAEVVRDGHNRTQSDATLLMRSASDTATPLDSKASKDQGKFHRRARTSSRSHNNAPPQFALFPQVTRRV